MKRFFLFIGIVFIIAGISAIVMSKNYEKRCTVETVGTVIEIIEDISTDSDGNETHSYYPVIEYKVGERIISKKSNTGSNSFKYHVNDKIAILYNSDKIDEYIIKGDKTAVLLGVIFIVLGFVAVIVGIKIMALINKVENKTERM